MQDENKRFDKLLKAMAEGEAPKAKASRGALASDKGTHNAQRSSAEEKRG